MNRVGVVRVLLAEKPELERYGREGLHALALAARDGRDEIVELLLKNGAAPEFADRDGRPALFWAIYKLQRQSTDLLLASGADPGAMSTEF
jgi:ankyrin repeat protein